jgi:lysophospholipase L1-like esterase
MLLVEGDSISEANYLLRSEIYGARAFAAITHGTYNSYARGGETLADMITQASWNAQCNRNVRFPVFMFQGGINDYVGGANVATIYSRMVTIAQAAKVAGCTVLAATMEDNAYVTLSDRVTLNNNIRANSTDWTVVDWGGNATVGCEGTGTCHLNATYFVDGTHLTAAGQQILADVLVPVLNSLGWN